MVHWQLSCKIREVFFPLRLAVLQQPDNFCNTVWFSQPQDAQSWASGRMPAQMYTFIKQVIKMKHKKTPICQADINEYHYLLQYVQLIG